MLLKQKIYIIITFQSRSCEVRGRAKDEITCGISSFPRVEAHYQKAAWTEIEPGPKADFIKLTSDLHLVSVLESGKRVYLESTNFFLQLIARLHFLLLFIVFYNLQCPLCFKYFFFPTFPFLILSLI